MTLTKVRDKISKTYAQVPCLLSLLLAFSCFLWQDVSSEITAFTRFLLNKFMHPGKPQNSSAGFQVPLSLPQPNFQNRVPAAPREESSAPSRPSWPIKGTSASPRWPTLPNICSFSATCANFHQGWKECAEVKCISR